MRINFLIILSFFPGFIYPCAVCYGDPESPMAQGMNMGVLTLIGFIGFVLLIIASSILIFALKSKHNNKIEGKL